MGNGGDPKQWTDLIPLFNTRTYSLGSKLTKFQDFKNKAKWGNPFVSNYIHDDVRYYYGPIPEASKFNEAPSVTLLHELYFYARYNPMRDNGQGNKVYMKSTSLSQGSFLSLPKEDIIASELPLWIIMWAWESWLNKAKPIQHIQDDYQLVIQTQFFLPKTSIICYTRQILCKHIRHRPNRNRQSKLASKNRISRREYSIHSKLRPSNT